MFYLYFSSIGTLCLIHVICTAPMTFFFLDDNFFEWSGSYSFTMLINFIDRYRLTAYGLSVGSPKADPETRGSETEGKSQKGSSRKQVTALCRVAAAGDPGEAAHGPQNCLLVRSTPPSLVRGYPGA